MLRTETLHQRDAVEPPRDEATRRHGDGYTAEQHADERRQDQKAPGIVDRAAHLGPRVAEVVDLVLGREQRLERASEAGQIGGVPRIQALVLGDAAGPEQPGAHDVVAGDEQRGRELHEPPALVGPKLERARDEDVERAEREPVADLEAEPREQARLGPGLARRGHAVGHARRAAEPIGDADLAAQRIAPRHAADVGERAPLARDEHAAELHDVSGRHAVGLRECRELGRQRAY